MPRVFPFFGKYALTHIKVLFSARNHALGMGDQDQRSPGRGDPFPHLSNALQSIAVSGTGDLDLEIIGRQLGRRSIGALLLVLALPMVLPVPAPGISVLFGVPMILVSAQLMLGRHSAWLPQRLARRSITRADFIVLVERALPSLRYLERIIRPRITWMAGDWAMIPVGAICVILAAIIALPVPLGHVVPGVAISVLAMGMIERDGLAIGAGLVVALIGFIIVVLASAGLVAALRTWLPMI